MHTNKNLYKAMKKLLLLNILLALIFTLKAQNRVIFYENFDAAVKPSGWTQEKVIGLGGTPSGSTISWQYTSGGYYGYPEYPYQGTRNAMFQLESDKGETTKLITPPIDISDVLKPELRFAHVQQIWEFEGTDYWDRLKIYYKRGADSAWVLLKTYDSAVPNWVDRSILLPDSSKSSTYYIAFEGKTGFGYGTCIDSMRIIETGLEAKYLSSYTINQASTDFIPTNTLRNPIININFDVKGNDGNIYLDSIKITSLNSDDSHISNNGVKLYVTTDSVFYNPIQIGNGINFENGVAFFKNLQYDLPRGNTTLWVTYDIAEALDHDIHNSIVDAKITAESIFINGYAYPFTDKSPEGFRLIKEAIFNDSFETNLGWTLNGSFEIAEPLGLGILFPGNPDPSDAYNGLKILGTDLTSDGVYSNELPKKYDNAISPNFNCRYFKDVTLYFARWLNIEYWDKATIDISNNNKATWTEIWRNTGAIIEDSWNIKSYNLNNANFYDNVSIRISIDTTNDVNQYTGWNIDDFIVIGNYISRDVGVSEIITPITSCGHTVSDEIKVKIKNYAGENSNDTIPIRYSIDNSTNYTVDTLFQSIPIGDSAIFTFSVGANLSASGSHSIKVETLLSGDEIPTNNSKSKTIFSFPTLVLPYIQNFENNYGYFLSGGINSTWSYGKPSSTLINSAASGTKAWVTNLIGPYSSNDSSYLESPCFNFTENDSIIFEFKCKGISEDKTDGLSILYTFDEGENWIPLPNDHDYYWNWYNETNISELELPGIDTTNGQWLTFRQLLPPAFSNKGTVKFRFVFESDASTNYEGFGIDDIKIYDAPYDVGVSSLTYPFDQCEWNDTTHVKIQVKNYGPTPVKTGTKIPLVMKFNSLTIKDTLTLTQNLAVNGTTPFTFTNTVDMSYAGAYDFTIYTKLESNTYFYDETTSNDTLYSIVNVLGMPRYNPFPNQIGDNPIDTFLVAGKDYVSYYWTRPSLPDTTTLTTDTLFIKNNEGWYKVTVTNANACQANDSVEVVNSEIDLAMDYIYTELVDSCERISLTEISVRFRNKSITTLEINDTVALAYQINDSQIVRDTLIVTTPIANDETGDFTFTIHADFKTPGDYTLKVFTDFLKDLNLSDDTLSVSFRTKGYVDIEFAYDTIFSSRADTLKLAPWTLHNTYSDYLWTPGGSTDDTLDVSLNISQWYKVTVSDIIVCESDSDSVYVETYDMAIENLNSPANRCQNNITGSTDINVRIKNYSGNTYNSSAPLTFMYNFNGAGWTEKNMTLGTTLIPNAETNLSLVNIDRTVPGEYSVEVYLKSAIDANSSNDSVNDIFETYPLPSVNLAYDTIFTSRADTVVLVADPGWNSYTWNTGSTNDSLFITSKYSREYYVDVEDEHGCGIASDTTWIITYNVGVNDLISPKSACEHSSTESVIISVKNYGQDTLLNGMKIPVGYILDGNSPVHETMTLSADLLPGKTTFYTFGSKVNISSINTYKFKVYTHLSLDVNTTNDTLVDVIKTFGYPSIEIGDNIYTTEPETLTLVAPSGYNNYKWNDGTTTNTLDIT